MIEKMQCPNCGGKINLNRMVCEYCGTRFKENNGQLLKIETFENPTKTYKARVCIPKEIAQSETQEVSEYCVNHLASMLAQSIKENMELESEYDAMMRSYKITAKIRVVEPKYVF